MLSIEVYRPDEMLLTLNQLNSRNSLKNMGRRLTHRQQPDNPYLQLDPEDVESSEDEEPHRRSKFKELLMKQ